MIKKYYLILFFFMSSSLQMAFAEESKDLLVKEKEVVEASFKKDSEKIILAVDGLCCKTCAIGIGKKVCKLIFIDTKSLNLGVKIDLKNGLLMVAIKAEAKVDLDLLYAAIRKAGDTPVRLYKKNDKGVVEVSEIAKKE